MSRPAGAVQVAGEVLSLRRVGAYWLMTLVAPGIAERARPGQFVALAVGGEHTSMVLRRAFAIYQVAERGVYGGTVEVVFAVHGKGTDWLARLHQHDPVDVVGPLGRPFRMPATVVPAVLVGGGYGSAPLFALAAELGRRRCRVDVVIGAGTADRLFGVLEAKRMAATLTVTTEDGSAGERGRVSDVLPDVIERSEAGLVYACGPMPMLRAVAAIADHYGLPCQVAVEESMACGIGVCMTCVLPIIGDDGITRMVRSCVDGPVFLADQVRFDDVGTVPAGTLGEPVEAVGT
ncbi:MAG: dihydroorotate dehydrogenase electron transfer subunit [Mycobacteriales bacterium]